MAGVAEGEGKSWIPHSAFRWLRGVAAFLGFLLALVTATPILEPWTSALSTPWGNEDGDLLIVLGGDLTEPGLVGVTSYWRSVYAVRTWRAGHFRKMIISGKDVAGPMRDFVVSQGVPADAVSIENEANSTRENALFTARMLSHDGGRKVLLTSDYHMSRALNAFRRAGIEASPIPFPDARKRSGTLSERWGVFCRLALETSKVGYYKVRGWM